MQLLIAIPVYNEQRYIRDVLEQVKHYHDQILVVDDGSTDPTPRSCGMSQVLMCCATPSTAAMGQV